MDFRNSNIDLVGKYRLWFSISAVVLLIGLVSWAAFGLNLGVDFRGGGQLQYRIPYSERPGSGEEVALLDRARAQLQEAGLENARLQIAGGDTLVIVTEADSNEQLSRQREIISNTLAPEFSGTNQQGQPQELGEPIAEEMVGPVIGQELRRNAIYGVSFGVLLIAGWIYIRYNFAGNGLRYAVAGIIALIHDVLVLLGIFALIGRIDPRIEIDGAFIAALLTVVGYSINDSVVIFDRIRENLRKNRKAPPNEVINASLLETMSRSINTGLTVIIMLLALLFFGGESIYNFVLAMVVGIMAGLYSSLFNASMVLVAWNNHDEKKAAEARAARTSRRQSREVATRSADSSTPRNTTANATTARPTTSATTRPLSASSDVANGTIASEGDVASETVVEPDEDGATAPDGATTPEGATGATGRDGSTTRRSTKARARRRY